MSFCLRNSRSVVAYGLLILGILPGLSVVVGCTKAAKPVPKPAAFSITIGEDWLPAPDSLPPTAVMYEEIVAGGNMANLAMASQAIGEARFGQGDKAGGLKFYAQAGRALRRAVEEDDYDRIHPTDISAIFYYEARALSRAEMLEEASVALGDSIRFGFDNIEMLKTDPDLEAIQATADFDERLANWIKNAVREKIKESPEFSIEFDTQDLQGIQITNTQLLGKVVVLDVWGMWCQPCIQELPSFISLQEKYADELQVVGFNFEQQGTLQQNLPRVISFTQKAGMNYPCVIGFDDIKRQIPNLNKYPTTVFLDKSGQVRYLAEGFHDPEYLEGIVSVLLEE